MAPNRGASGPWSRLKPVEQDPLEIMGLPSKGETRSVFAASVRSLGLAADIERSEGPGSGGGIPRKPTAND